MEIRNLAAFLKAAELLNFSKTAGELNYTQAAITTQIKQLEDMLGVRLFNRANSKISLTEDGQSFIPYAAKIIEGVNEAMRFKDDRDLIEGKLKVGSDYVLHSCVLLKLLPYFHLKYPRVETSIVKKSTKELTQKLNQNELDIIFFTGSSINNGNWTKIMELPVDVVFVAPVAHKFAGRPIVLEDLIDEPFILVEKDMCYRDDFEQLFSSSGKSAHVAMELSDASDIARVLPKTNCISFLPYHVVKEYVDNGYITIIDVIDVNIKTYIQMMHRVNRAPTLPMQAFLRTVKTYCNSAEVWGVLQLNKDLSKRITDLEAL